MTLAPAEQVREPRTKSALGPWIRYGRVLGQHGPRNGRTGTSEPWKRRGLLLLGQDAGLDSASFLFSGQDASASSSPSLVIHPRAPAAHHTLVCLVGAYQETPGLSVPPQLIVLL